MEFVEFPKMARLSRECVVTEKIDGTNAQILIVPLANDPNYPGVRAGDFILRPGSRNRFLSPDEDNFGFARWVYEHAAELVTLGEGRHFGEWWGSGIQRGYGLTKGEKRFSLFNVARWHRVGADPYISVSGDPRQSPKFSTEAPACCDVVPILYRGDFQTSAVDFCLTNMRELGSKAAPGFMQPEGVVVFHAASGQMFKKTIEKDDEPKSKRTAA